MLTLKDENEKEMACKRSLIPSPISTSSFIYIIPPYQLLSHVEKATVTMTIFRLSPRFVIGLDEGGAAQWCLMGVVW